MRDTQHFISRLKQLGPIPDNALLVTLHVSSLYTKIPNHEGLLAVADHLRSDLDKQKIEPPFITTTKISLTLHEF